MYLLTKSALTFCSIKLVLAPVWRIEIEAINKRRKVWHKSLSDTTFIKGFNLMVNIIWNEKADRYKLKSIKFASFCQIFYSISLVLRDFVIPLHSSCKNIFQTKTSRPVNQIFGVCNIKRSILHFQKFIYFQECAKKTSAIPIVKRGQRSAQ